MNGLINSDKPRDISGARIVFIRNAGADGTDNASHSLASYWRLSFSFIVDILPVLACDALDTQEGLRMAGHHQRHRFYALVVEEM